MNRSFFACALVFSLVSEAQVLFKHSIAFQAGVATTNDFLNDANSVITSDVSGGDLSYGNTTAGPALTGSYHYGLYDAFEVGVEFIYQTIRQKAFVDDVEAGDVFNTYYSIGAGARYIYMSNAWFSMYGGAHVAFTTEQSEYRGNSPEFKSNSSGYVNFHLNPLGLRFGKAVAATVELGIGYRGLAAVGLTWRF